MIPINITREHIIQAINEIRKNGVPKGRESRKYDLEYEHSYYPPKYAVALANKYANGEILSFQLFNGGYEANSFLQARGFSIFSKNMKSNKTTRLIENSRRNQNGNTISTHAERCPACKENIHNLLIKLYGYVEKNKSLALGSRLEDYKESPAYPVLERIYKALQEYRGHVDFVNTDKLPRCDFFISDPATIVEYDERQHFTKAREISLSLYPEEIRTQFDIGKWKDRCRCIIAEDKSPVYRDEQRAWYDTLRDFAPELLGIQPTIRILDKEKNWCEMDENNETDLMGFARYVREGGSPPRIYVRSEPNPKLARLIISGPWNAELTEARRILGRVCDIWPKDVRVQYFITCGGFMKFKLPNDLEKEAKKSRKDYSCEDINAIYQEAKAIAQNILGGGLRESLSNHAEYMTIGIDSEKVGISTTQTHIKETHAELVLLIGLKTKIHYCTGKSYPTNNQQKTLVRISDLSSHFPDIPNSPKLMVLGCHDLAIFSPRSDNSKGERRALRDRFRQMAIEKQPEVVLQHPHTADSTRTWSAMWKKMGKMLPSVRLYGGAGRYHNKARGQRSPLNEVLQKTKRGPSLDFIVRND
jgi:hypothetical protein